MLRETMSSRNLVVLVIATHVDDREITEWSRILANRRSTYTRKHRK